MWFAARELREVDPGRRSRPRKVPTPHASATKTGRLFSGVLILSLFGLQPSVALSRLVLQQALVGHDARRPLAVFALVRLALLLERLRRPGRYVDVRGVFPECLPACSSKHRLEPAHRSSASRRSSSAERAPEQVERPHPRPRKAEVRVLGWRPLVGERRARVRSQVGRVARPRRADLGRQDSKGVFCSCSGLEPRCLAEQVRRRRRRSSSRLAAAAAATSAATAPFPRAPHHDLTRVRGREPATLALDVVEWVRSLFRRRIPSCPPPLVSVCVAS